MTTVTAVYQGQEIGFGESSSEGYLYAIEECIDSIPTMYIEGALDDIDLHFHNVKGSTLPAYVKLTDYYYQERQYF
jgi:hypothetical protein